METENKALIELKEMLSSAMITQIDLDLKIKLVCKLNEAINYTHSSTLLKEKEAMTFEVWLFDNYEGISINYKEKNGYKYEENLSIVDMYEKYKSL